MEQSKKPENTRRHRDLDRPSRSVPSVDRPWDDPSDREHRLKTVKGDRSAHRVHHALYEDMLN